LLRSPFVSMAASIMSSSFISRRLECSGGIVHPTDFEHSRTICTLSIIEVVFRLGWLGDLRGLHVPLYMSLSWSIWLSALVSIDGQNDGSTSSSWVVSTESEWVLRCLAIVLKGLQVVLSH
jgi:hypothetical protein